MTMMVMGDVLTHKVGHTASSHILADDPTQSPFCFLLVSCHLSSCCEQ